MVRFVEPEAEDTQGSAFLGFNGTGFRDWGLGFGVWGVGND